MEISIWSSPALLLKAKTACRTGAYLTCLDQENWSVKTGFGFRYLSSAIATSQKKTRDSASLNIFKTRINPNTEKPPRYYFIGKRLGQIYHARLRTNCSSPRQHLFSKNIVDSPVCECGSVEDTHHYLLVCGWLVVLRLNVPVNNFPVMSGRSHRFLGN